MENMKNEPSSEEVKEFLAGDDGKKLRIPNCAHPTTFPVRRRVDKNGPEWPIEDRRYISEYRALAPCGKCRWCRRNLKNEWYGKLIAEFHSHDLGAEHSFVHLTLSPEGMKASGLDFNEQWVSQLRERNVFEWVRKLFLDAFDQEGRPEGVPVWVFDVPGAFPDPDREQVRVPYIINWFRMLPTEVRRRFAWSYGYQLDEFTSHLYAYRTLREFRREARQAMVKAIRNYTNRLRYYAKVYIDNERERLKDVKTETAIKYLAFLDSIYDKNPRFFFVSEYGDLNGRLHFHMMIFGWLACIGDNTVTKLVKGKTITECHCDVCKLIDKAWGHGFVQSSTIGDPEATALYTIKYILKDIENDNALPEHFPVNAHGASRSPPLGERLVYAVAKAMLGYEHGSAKQVYDRLLKNGMFVGGKQYNLGRNALRRLRRFLGVSQEGFAQAVKNDTANMGAIAAEAGEYLAPAAQIQHGRKREKIKKQDNRDKKVREIKINSRSRKQKGGSDV